jgi:hypothetical protein
VGGGEGGGGEGEGEAAAAGGKDAAGKHYESVAAFWEHCEANAVGWYAVAARRWQVRAGVVRVWVRVRARARARARGRGRGRVRGRVTGRSSTW